jgi:hypothetical protein
MEPISMAVLGASLIAGLGTASWAALKGWQGWLELKRLELAQGCAASAPPPANTGNRIEIADLRERVRKLEAIAAGIDL